MQLIINNDYYLFDNSVIRIHQKFNSKPHGSLVHLNLNRLEPNQKVNLKIKKGNFKFKKIISVRIPTSEPTFNKNCVVYLFENNKTNYVISKTQIENNFKKFFKPHFPNSKGLFILEKTIKLKSENNTVCYLKHGTEVELADKIFWKLSDKNEEMYGFKLWFNNHLYTYWGPEQLFMNHFVHF